MNMTTLAGILAAILLSLGVGYAITHYQIKPKVSSSGNLMEQVLTRGDSPIETQPQVSSDELLATVGAKKTPPQPISSKPAAKGDTVVVNYIGKLENGTVFDSSEGKDPFSFVLGAGHVIKGWDEGVVGMKIGEIKQLTISPEKAYGPRGVKGSDTSYIIPPNATLHFIIQVLDIQSPK